MPFPYTLPVVFGGTTTPFLTAGEVVNRTALRVGLTQAPDPFSSTDGNILQLCSLLDDCGKELWRERNWTHLTQDHTFTTIADQSAYPLPPGFGFMLNQTGWNRTNRLPFAGPLSNQEWQYLKAQNVSLALTVMFRPLQQQIVLYPDVNTPAGYTIAFSYVSRFWVQTATASAPDSDTPINTSDIIWFDALLITRALKLAFLKAKNFDTTSAQADYDRALQLCMGDDGYAPILNLAGRSNTLPLVGAQNIPWTGFGGGV